MRFDVPLTEYEACGRCGHTWPPGGFTSQLAVTDRDLARAVTGNTVSRLVGQTGPDPRRARMLLRSSLLRIRAVVRPARRGALTGHSIMGTHHGSARTGLSEDFGIAMAISFLTKTHGLRQHYNLDAVPNKPKFGIPSGKRPDIGSVAPTGEHFLTEAKGRKDRRDLEPRPFGVEEPAKLVRSCFQQLTSEGKANLAASTSLFVCVTSPIAAGRDIRLDTAEYVTRLANRCPMCGVVNVLDDERSRGPVEPPIETDWNGLQSGWYRSYANIVGGTDADLDETGQYHVHEVAGADVTIGLHRQIAQHVSTPDESLSRRLSDALDSLPENLDTADDGRYSDGTLIRTEWPELEADDEDDAGDVQ